MIITNPRRSENAQSVPCKKFLTYFLLFHIIILQSRNTQKAVYPTIKWELKKQRVELKSSTLFQERI